MLARNSDLCRLAASSWALLSAISRKSRAFWMARADCVAKVFRTSITSGGNSPGAFRLKDRLPMIWSSRSKGTERSARYPNRMRVSRTLLSYAPGWMMSGTWMGSRISAARPMSPSPFRRGTARRASTNSVSLLWVARSSNCSAAASYSKIEHPSALASWLARVTMVSSTVSTSSVELTARLTSPRAVSFSTDWVSSLVRASSSLNSRTFSMAMTA